MPNNIMNKPVATRRLSRCLIVLALVLIPTFLRGGTEPVDHSKEAPPPIEKSWCETPPAWEIRVGVPGWLAGLSGESGAKGIVSDVDVPFHQLLSHLTHFPIALMADLRYQRWEFFGDGMYEEVGDSMSLPGLLFTTANVHIKVAQIEGFIGYRLINCDKASLSVFAGARYNYEHVNISILDNGDARLPLLRELAGLPRNLEASGSIDWVDPVLGARGKVKLWKAVSLWAEGDVGGFDVNADSAFEVRREGGTIVRRPVSAEDWSYQLQGGLEIQLTRRIVSQIGWRYLKNNYRNEGFTNKTELSGPVLNTLITF
jgi:hypothetical protein